jgi:hypothetical protein
VTVASRLRRLEQQSHVAGSQTVRLFWPAQLMPCSEHPGCDIEVQTGAHHRGVIHLSFEGPL